jgi:hypothetical protein
MIFMDFPWIFIDFPWIFHGFSHERQPMIFQAAIFSWLSAVHLCGAGGDQARSMGIGCSRIHEKTIFQLVGGLEHVLLLLFSIYWE